MPCTGEQFDALLEEFELCAARHAAVLGKVVKLRTAESTLLTSAENIRDACQDALQGSKEVLRDVFGSNDCQRVVRARSIKGSVKLSDMKKSDKRWTDLEVVLASIEKVLKALSAEKPWDFPNDSPCDEIQPVRERVLENGCRVVPADGGHSGQLVINTVEAKFESMATAETCAETACSKVGPEPDPIKNRQGLSADSHVSAREEVEVSMHAEIPSNITSGRVEASLQENRSTDLALNNANTEWQITTMQSMIDTAVSVTLPASHEADPASGQVSRQPVAIKPKNTSDTTAHSNIETTAASGTHGCSSNLFAALQDPEVKTQSSTCEEMPSQQQFLGGVTSQSVHQATPEELAADPERAAGRVPQEIQRPLKNEVTNAFPDGLNTDFSRPVPSKDETTVERTTELETTDDTASPPFGRNVQPTEDSQHPAAEVHYSLYKGAPCVHPATRTLDRAEPGVLSLDPALMDDCRVRQESFGQSSVNGQLTGALPAALNRDFVPPISSRRKVTFGGAAHIEADAAIASTTSACSLESPEDTQPCAANCGSTPCSGAHNGGEASPLGLKRDSIKRIPKTLVVQIETNATKASTAFPCDSEQRQNEQQPSPTSRQLPCRGASDAGATSWSVNQAEPERLSLDPALINVCQVDQDPSVQPTDNGELIGPLPAGLSGDFVQPSEITSEGTSRTEADAATASNAFICSLESPEAPQPRSANCGNTPCNDAPTEGGASPLGLKPDSVQSIPKAIEAQIETNACRGASDGGATSWSVDQAEPERLSFDPALINVCQVHQDPPVQPTLNREVTGAGPASLNGNFVQPWTSHTEANTTLTGTALESSLGPLEEHQHMAADSCNGTHIAGASRSIVDQGGPEGLSLDPALMKVCQFDRDLPLQPIVNEDVNGTFLEGLNKDSTSGLISKAAFEQRLSEIESVDEFLLHSDNTDGVAGRCMDRTKPEQILLDPALQDSHQMCKDSTIQAIADEDVDAYHVLASPGLLGKHENNLALGMYSEPPNAIKGESLLDATRLPEASSRSSSHPSEDRVRPAMVVHSSVPNNPEITRGTTRSHIGGREAPLTSTPCSMTSQAPSVCNKVVKKAALEACDASVFGTQTNAARSQVSPTRSGKSKAMRLAALDACEEPGTPRLAYAQEITRQPFSRSLGTSGNSVSRGRANPTSSPFTRQYDRNATSTRVGSIDNAKQRSRGVPRVVAPATTDWNAAGSRRRSLSAEEIVHLPYQHWTSYEQNSLEESLKAMVSGVDMFVRDLKSRQRERDVWCGDQSWENATEGSRGGEISAKDGSSGHEGRADSAEWQTWTNPTDSSARRDVVDASRQDDQRPYCQLEKK
eukprot:TRINITY_DN12444_c0_g4_i1.p1 TRINITY_DN12444_c0_g4~~TRINITY_DN12444_c0_g4_i1.p1  ORF type:complete len:1338 (+),score=163.47 TRINITY_DN12444_c0_g4_i1:99-4112(+)